MEYLVSAALYNMLKPVVPHKSYGHSYDQINWKYSSNNQQGYAKCNIWFLLWVCWNFFVFPYILVD